MIIYKCDRCGKVFDDGRSLFKVDIKHPEVYEVLDYTVKYCYGTLHFCTDCMRKVGECVEELGRND